MCSLRPRGSTWVLLKLRIAGFSLTSDWSKGKGGVGLACSSGTSAIHWQDMPCKLLKSFRAMRRAARQAKVSKHKVSRNLHCRFGQQKVTGVSGSRWALIPRYGVAYREIISHFRALPAGAKEIHPIQSRKLRLPPVRLW